MIGLGIFSKFNQDFETEEVAKLRASTILKGRVDDRDLDFGLALAAQLDELLEEEDGDDGLGRDDGPDGGRVDGVLSYADGLDGGEGSTLADGDDDDDVCKRLFGRAFRGDSIESFISV